jgi:membrane protein implicated in regulation of membrane protease activity
VPLTNTSVTLAGQPSKVGGTVARVFGWIVLAAGLCLAAGLAGLILLLGGTWAAAVTGVPIALIASVIAYALLRSGRELKKSGDDTEAATKNQAIFALANARNGVLKAWDVAQMLQVTPKEGDDILTKLAKEHPDYVTVDVDDEGNVLYRFPAIHWGGLPRMAPNAPMAPNAVPPHVRVQAPRPQPRVSSDAGASVRVDPREPLEDEFEQAEPARQKLR